MNYKTIQEDHPLGAWTRELATAKAAAKMSARMAASACKFCLLIILISHITTQLNCQITSPTSAGSGPRSPAHKRACNHQDGDHLQEPEVDELPEVRQMKSNSQRRRPKPQQQQQQQQLFNKRMLTNEQHRQQRQFTQQTSRSAAMLMNDLPPAPSSAPQPEEFSLASPSSAATLAVDLQASASEQQPQQHSPTPTTPHDTIGNFSAGSGYLLLSEPEPGNPSSTTSTTTASVTTTGSGNSTWRSSGAEPVTSTEQAPVMNTTPTLASDSISSPVVGGQPAATTSSSVQVSTSKPQQQAQQQSRQQARRMEESSTSAAERHSSNLPESPPASSSSHSISSSPSSVSVITPLIGPPTQREQQQQQQQSSTSMIKPIYVLGNPINELEQHSNYNPPKRAEKRIDAPEVAQQSAQHEANATEQQQQQSGEGERMNGPALVYSDGHLVGVNQQHEQTNSTINHQSSESTGPQPPTAPSPRLFQAGSGSGAAVVGNQPRRPSLPPPVNQANAASGFRSPMSPSGPLIGQPTAATNSNQVATPPASSSMLQPSVNSQLPLSFYQTAPPYAGGGSQMFGGSGGVQSLHHNQQLSNKQAFVLAQQQQQQQQQQHALAGQIVHSSSSSSSASSDMPIQFQVQQVPVQTPQASITSSTTSLQQVGQQQQQQQQQPNGSAAQVYHSRRPLNITRVEHISAECSNDLIRAVIVFNGTFKGIIYSSGYVSDPTCLYVNGTGLTRYEFSIRLNQCGTLGRQELHQPTIPGEARRRDQVMWNTLSIQYNPVIEQEWDEHFRVSCEYGSDFWKTISFSPFNVETNTGAPVVFTINPPQCQMDVIFGHGMGPKIAVDGPVTVGDPLTLLIHMKSEKAGYDILVKNCIAHNGGKQRMQLIDSNGCVVNERFISPFRGTYNDNDLRHVTLYAYLKAFRFTGSPVLYLECEIHMCQSACPPQMCYWRRLSKRSVENSDYEYTDERNSTSEADYANRTTQPVISDSLSLFKALQVRQEPIEPARARQRAQQLQEIYAEDDEAQLVCYRHAEVVVFLSTIGALLLLVLSIAITCCLRIRKLTRTDRKLFEHTRFASSVSPSLLSISGAGSSIMSQQLGSGNCWQTGAHQQQVSPIQSRLNGVYNVDGQRNNGIYR